MQIKKSKLASITSLLAGLFIMATALITPITAFLDQANAAPGDMTWQQAGTTGITGDQKDWISITSSADGTKLAAVVQHGSI